MKWIILVAATLALGDCDGKQPIKTSEACEVIKNVAYPNCRFRWTKEELASISEENHIKITAIKTFFRKCPQARKCVGQGN